MSNLKCPFCQQELNQDNPQSIECKNDDCKKSYFMYGSKELWQALTDSMREHDLCHDALVERTKELERTRKAFDKAKWWLNEIVENHRFTPISTAEMALEEITALEQNEK